MGERAELVLTWGTCLLCALIATAALWPRLTVRQVPITIEEAPIHVSIGGAVHQPGSYSLPFRSTVGDLVAAAGGITDAADPALVSSSVPLTAGDNVFVPTRMSATGTSRISINSATLEELQRLPGVGPVTAQRILEGRPYSRIEDLLRVKGIGEKTLDRLATVVTL